MLKNSNLLHLQRREEYYDKNKNYFQENEIPKSISNNSGVQLKNKQFKDDRYNNYNTYSNTNKKFSIIEDNDKGNLNNNFESKNFKTITKKKESSSKPSYSSISKAIEVLFTMIYEYKKLDKFKQIFTLNSNFDPLCLFIRLDTNGKKKISGLDIEQFLKENSMFSHNHNFSIPILIENFDLDNDKKLNFEEFSRLLLPFSNNYCRSYFTQKPFNKQKLSKEMEIEFSTFLFEYLKCFETINSQKLELIFEEESLFKLFKYFDKDRDALLSIFDFEKVFKKYKIFLPKHEIFLLILMYDKDQDEKISLEEFLCMILPSMNSYKPKDDDLKIYLLEYEKYKQTLINEEIKRELEKEKYQINNPDYKSDVNLFKKPNDLLTNTIVLTTKNNNYSNSQTNKTKISKVQTKNQIPSDTNSTTKNIINQINHELNQERNNRKQHNLKQFNRHHENNTTYSLKKSNSNNKPTNKNQINVYSRPTSNRNSLSIPKSIRKSEENMRNSKSITKITKNIFSSRDNKDYKDNNLYIHYSNSNERDEIINNSIFEYKTTNYNQTNHLGYQNLKTDSKIKSPNYNYNITSQLKGSKVDKNNIRKNLFGLHKELLVLLQIEQALENSKFQLSKIKDPFSFSKFLAFLNSFSFENFSTFNNQDQQTLSFNSFIKILDYFKVYSIEKQFNKEEVTELYFRLEAFSIAEEFNLDPLDNNNGLSDKILSYLILPIDLDQAELMINKEEEGFNESISKDIFLLVKEILTLHLLSNKSRLELIHTLRFTSDEIQEMFYEIDYSDNGYISMKDVNF